MAPHLGLQRIMIPSAQVSSLTTGSITLPSAKGAFVNNSFESIATYSGTGSAGNITFSSIPQTYKHLQLRTITNTNRVSNPSGSGSIYFNGDTTATNYYTHALYGNNAGSVNPFSANENDGVWWYGDATPTYVVSIIDILEYTNTSKKTTIRQSTAYEESGVGQIAWASLFWNNTAAVTSIVFNPQGQYWGANSRFSLYGIKGD